MKTIPVLLALLLPATLQAQDTPKPTPPRPAESTDAVGYLDAVLESPDDILTRTLDVTASDVELDALMEMASVQLKLELNVVYKNGADKVVIPHISLRNVTLKSFLDVVTQVGEVRLDLINDTGGKLAKNGIIFFEAPKPRVTTRSGTRLERVTVTPAPNPTGPKPTAPPSPPGPSRPGSPPKATPANPFADFVNPADALTRVFSLAHLNVEPDRIVETIQTTWQVSGDSKSGQIVLHDKTSLLIIRAPAPRMDEAEQVLQTFSEQEEVKFVKNQNELKRQLKELEHDAAMRLDKLQTELENQRAINNQLEKELSALRSRGKFAD